MARRSFPKARVLVGITLIVLGILIPLSALALAPTATPAPEKTPTFARSEESTDAATTVTAGLQVDALGRKVAVDRDVSVAYSVPIPSKRVALGSGDLPVDSRAVPVSANLDLGIESRSASGRATTEADTVEVAAAASAPMSADVALLAGAAVALTGLLVSFWSQVKGLLTKLLILPLYAHIERGEVFDNPVRERLFQLVKADPGVSATELADRAGVSWGTTLYHLNVLEQNRMVVGVKHGRYLRYFENGARKDGDAQCVLRNATTSRVQDAIAAGAGRTQKELAELLGMSPQALHWHLRRLESAGLLTKVKEGRVVRHYAAPVIAAPSA